MEKFEEASARLQAAVERLDKVLSNGAGENVAGRVSTLFDALSAVESERDSIKSDLDGLQTEQNRLHRALREAQEKYAAMQVVNEAVVGRIDGTIGGLRKMLKGG